MKRKFLSIAVALAMLLPVAFAAIPFSAAATTDWTTSVSGLAMLAFLPDGTIFITGAADAGASVVSKQGVSFTAANAISSKIDIPVQAAVTDTAHSGTHCYQYFGFSIASAAISAVPTTSPNSCIASSAGTILEIRIATNNADNTILPYYYLDGAYVGGGTAVAGLTADAEYTFEYAIEGNDVKLYFTNASEEKNLLYTFTDKAADFAKENIAAVGFVNSAYGSDLTKSYTVKTLNDATPGSYSSFIEFAPVFDPDSSNWNVLTPLLVNSSTGSIGSVTYNKKGAMILNCLTGWWGQAGVAYNAKTSLEGLSVTFNKPVFTDPSPNGHFDIMVNGGSSAPSTYNTTMTGGATYAPAKGRTIALALMFYGSSAGALAFNSVGSVGACGTVGDVVFTNAYNDAEGKDTTITFGEIFTGMYDDDGDEATPEVEGKFCYIYMNGIALQVKDLIDEIEDEDTGDVTPVYGEPYDFAFNVTRVVDEDNKCFLTLSATGYGTSGGRVTVKSVNGSVTGYTSVKNESSNRAKILGAQYRLDPNGIRFATQININDINGVASTNEGAVSLANIASYGTLIMPADKLAYPGELMFTDDDTINGVPYLNIVGSKYYLFENTYFTFTAVLIGIPNSGVGEANYGRDFVAVSYIKYADGAIVYSAPCIRSIEDISVAITRYDYNASAIYDLPIYD